ncbi:hypothetical protein RRG08_026096 [Elysia crispata]|uniref:Uncharacterized protein n=1 Tax=Elysia crispata TaxID=231223 RepID=A0AAE0YS10_9GAST|nr:hypothetical protein RRG08_026096 [Elysia crispata]
MLPSAALLISYHIPDALIRSKSQNNDWSWRESSSIISVSCPWHRDLRHTSARYTSGRLALGLDPTHHQCVSHTAPSAWPILTCELSSLATFLVCPQAPCDLPTSRQSLVLFLWLSKELTKSGGRFSLAFGYQLRDSESQARLGDAIKLATSQASTAQECQDISTGLSSVACR